MSNELNETVTHARGSIGGVQFCNFENIDQHKVKNISQIMSVHALKTEVDRLQKILQCSV